jgi:hypothetical protein
VPRRFSPLLWSRDALRNALAHLDSPFSSHSQRYSSSNVKDEAKGTPESSRPPPPPPAHRRSSRPGRSGRSGRIARDSLALPVRCGLKREIRGVVGHLSLKIIVPPKSINPFVIALLARARTFCPKLTKPVVVGCCDFSIAIYRLLFIIYYLLFIIINYLLLLLLSLLFC